MKNHLIICIAILLLGCSSPKSKNDPPYVKVSVSNNDASKINESILVTINDIVIISSDTMRGEVTYVPEQTALSIHVSTSDGRLALDTTYDIPDSFEGLGIYISYNDYEEISTPEFFKKSTKYQYANSLKHNKLNPDTTIPWLVDSLDNIEKRELKRIHKKRSQHIPNPYFNIGLSETKHTTPYILE